jgi:hypothetical protein
MGFDINADAASNQRYSKEDRAVSRRRFAACFRGSC